MRNRILSVAIAAVLLVAAQASAQVTKPTVVGVTNFAKLESTIACAGATTPSGIAEVKKLGYKSVINLREASEAGADVDAEAAALGLTNPALKAFATDYAMAHAR